MNNETIGISAELAIAEVFRVNVSPEYARRADKSVIKAAKQVVIPAFNMYGIPPPVRHIAEKHNAVDFELEGGKTLSVKTNQGKMGKVAPQRVGQATSETHFRYFRDLYPYIPAGYAEKSAAFKRAVTGSPAEFINVYWENLFDCDYLIYFYKFLAGGGLYIPHFTVFGKLEAPYWDPAAFSFTQTPESWNESNTIKYDGIKIGEFQVHKNRDNFKFRFNLDGLKAICRPL